MTAVVSRATLLRQGRQLAAATLAGTVKGWAFSPVLAPVGSVVLVSA